MEKNIENLENQIQALKKENELLSNSLSSAQSKLMYHDYVFSKACYFKNKILFLICFLNFLGDQACAYGSIVRKFFDYSLRFEKASILSSGNITHDINVVFMGQRSHNRARTARDFYNIIRILEQTLLYQHINKDCKDMRFGSYKLISIEVMSDLQDDLSKIIPRAVLHFMGEYKNSENLTICDKVMVKLQGWFDQPTIDYSVNSCVLTKNGIQLMTQHSITSFYDFIENLCYNQTSSMINLEIYQENAFPKNTSVTRDIKSMFLRKIYNFIVDRYLRVFESGFQIVGYCPSIFIESKEECHLTSCRAPYPCLMLECGHNISLMGYKGIIEKGDVDGTESIRCPMCRSDLKIKFNHQAESKTFFEQYDFGRILITEVERKRTFDQHFVSQDSFEHL